MKHLPHPSTDFKSLCGLPFGGKRTDGRRHTLPELAGVADFSKCLWYASMRNAALKRGE